jgi:pimeloyl-ACP methyl ester carboxylesterase
MGRRINDVQVHYVEHGDGVPLVALHGAGVDDREIEAAIEAIAPRGGYRRIYPDLRNGPLDDRRPDVKRRCCDVAR